MPELRTDATKEVFTVDELAAFLRVSRDTVYRAIQLGQIPGVLKVGRAIRISRTAVLSWAYGEEGRDWRSKGKKR